MTRTSTPTVLPASSGFTTFNRYVSRMSMVKFPVQFRYTSMSRFGHDESRAVSVKLPSTG